MLMKKVFSDYFYETVSMLKCPKLYSAETSSAMRNFPGRRFILPVSAFVLCSIIQAAFLVLGGESLIEAYSGLPMAVNSPFYVIFLVGLCSDFFTAFAISSLMSFYLPFLSAGRIPLRLPVVLILIPAAYASLFLIPMPVFCRAIISLLPLAGMSISAKNNRQNFMALLYSVFMLSMPLLAFGLLMVFSAVLESSVLFFIINLVSSLFSLVYLIAFSSGIFKASAAKSFVALLAAGIFIMAYLQLLAFSKIIPPEIAQLIPFS